MQSKSNTGYTMNYEERDEYLRQKRKWMTYRNITLLIVTLILITQNVMLHLENSKLKEENIELAKYLGTLADKVQVQATTISTLESEVKSLNAEVNKLSIVVEKLSLPPFDSNDLRKASNATAERLDYKFNGTPLKGLGDDIIKAEQKYGVNAYLIAGILCWESGWGESKKFKEKNNGFGWMCYPETEKSNGKTFASVEESIDIVARAIRRDYLTDGGKSHRGFGIRDMNKSWAKNLNGTVNYEWSSGVLSIMKQLSRN